jgi:hypothetical protein
MITEPAVPGRNTIFGLLALLVFYGIAGVLDRKNIPYGGFDWGRGYEVTEVDAGGPADLAGLQVGDSLVSIDGIPMTDLRAQQRQRRAAIGETRDLVVARSDPSTETTATHVIPVSYGPQPDHPVSDWLPGLALGIAFVLLGVYVYLKMLSRSALLYWALCFCFGLVMIPKPYLANFPLRMVQEALGFICFFLAFGLLLHLLLLLPTPRPFLEKASARTWIYLPAVLATVLGIFTMVFQPGSSFTPFLLVVLFLAYPVLSLVAMFRTYSGATPEERSRFGLHYLMGGSILGLVPIILLVLAGTFAPEITIPGSEFFFFSLLLVPVGLAVVLLREGRKPAVVL